MVCGWWCRTGSLGRAEEILGSSSSIGPRQWVFAERQEVHTARTTRPSGWGKSIVCWDRRVNHLWWPEVPRLPCRNRGILHDVFWGPVVSECKGMCGCGGVSAPCRLSRFVNALQRRWSYAFRVTEFPDGAYLHWMMSSTRRLIPFIIKSTQSMSFFHDMTYVFPLFLLHRTLAM